MIEKVLITHKDKKGYVWIDFDLELKVFGVTQETPIKPGELYLEHTQCFPDVYDICKANFDDYIENSYKIAAADAIFGLEGIPTRAEYLARERFPIKDETTENDKNTLKMFQSIFIEGYNKSEQEKE